ncbi:RecB family exonuclease [Catalinimonas alkaloidigena]|uniref:PD-(D/E)XK nuclease family protein n=1 Tax=Catalinimonas alkaloidigena TaxID=1075417 RepID=UPI0024057936|nr:PD-(D/E)XK nuclease family protein [Catalinimonas alkaloidigena]MDF9795312.1 RecB family exonuclease [Catalinimonas alkaloidigena]
MDRMSFLQKIVTNVIRDFSDELKDATVVFPNRRAGIFFKDLLAKRLDNASWMPQVCTLEDLAARLSDLVLADKLSLVYQLYEVFRQNDRQIESFDRFYFWGELLLADFSEVDMAMVNAKDLFSNLKDLKSIEAGYDYLTEDQKKVIARFWESFQYEEEKKAVGSSQERFLLFWNKLYPIYQQYREALTKQGLAYEGLVFRHVADQLKNDAVSLPSGSFVFVGLNALKNAELQIVKQLVSQEKATVYWDIDAYYLNNEVQEAGVFLRKYLRSTTLAPTFPKAIPNQYHSGKERQIHIHGVPLEVGQAKKTGEFLQELSKKEGFNPERCVVVLPDEHMLFPVLHALPPVIPKVNVTMGYPLRNTSLYSFIEHLLDLQLEKKQVQQQYTYHYESLLALLRHPFIKNYAPALAELNIQHIIQSNAVYIHQEDLEGDTTFFQNLLTAVEDVPHLFSYLLHWSAQLHQLLNQEEENANNAAHELSESEDGASSQNIPMLEQELLYHFYIHLNRLKSLTQERQFDFELPAFIKLLRQIFQSLRVPFTGEPLRGLQIMGLLETRNLDFDHVFVLSMNEGVMPASSSQTSFIPANLKKGFGLFGVDQQDAFYAHAFFRLLHHAQHVHLFYNTEDTSQLSGEMSRFLYQLYYESAYNESDELRFPDAKGDFIVHRDYLSMQVSPSIVKPISITKSEDVWKQMLRYINTDENSARSSLTPSALNTYLDCRLKFYYKYVARLKETEEVEEELDARVFGNILHKTMEVLYKRLISLKGSKKIEAEDCLQLKGEKLEEAIQKGFKEHYQPEKAQAFTFEGRNIIAREIVKKMAKQILDHDSRYAPFEIVSLEKGGKAGHHAQLTVSVNGTNISIPLRGIIDRIDRKEGVVRVLDYKTGRDERKAVDIQSMFDREHPGRNKAAMQALLYAWLYQKNQYHENESIVPGLVNATELFKEDFDPSLILEGEKVNSFERYQDEFISSLSRLLEEIFNKEVPFDQTDDEKKCGFCPYANICY